MASRRPQCCSTFVQRHDLWTDEQARRAKAVAQAIKKNKLELVRFSFADQHGVLRGKTVVAADAPGLDAKRRDHDHDAPCQGYGA